MVLQKGHIAGGGVGVWQTANREHVWGKVGFEQVTTYNDPHEDTDQAPSRSCKL